MRLRYCTKMIRVPSVTAPAIIFGAVRLITRMMKATWKTKVKRLWEPYSVKEVRVSSLYLS